MTFKVNGEQYVIVPVGWGGAFRLWSPSTMMVTPTSKYGPSRLVAFKLGGRQPFPLPAIQVPEVPHPPAQTYTAEQVKQGAVLADDHGCTDCHSPKFMARDVGRSMAVYRICAICRPRRIGIGTPSSWAAPTSNKG